MIPIVAKVFERILYDQFYEYLIANNLISSNQSGFRSLHSTPTALIEASDNWAFNIEKGNVNAVNELFPTSFQKTRFAVTSNVQNLLCRKELRLTEYATDIELITKQVISAVPGNL